MRSWNFNVTTIRFVSSKYAHRNDDGVGFNHGQSNAGARGLQSAVERPRAFGKQNDRAAREQTIQNCSQSRRAAAIAIHRNRIPFSQQPTNAGKSEKAFTRQKIDAAMQSRTDQRRIKKDGVVGSKNDRPG